GVTRDISLQAAPETAAANPPHAADTTAQDTSAPEPPEAGDLQMSPRGQRLAVRRKSHGTDGREQPVEEPDHSAVGSVPKDDGVILAGRGQVFAVGGIGQG